MKTLKSSREALVDAVLERDLDPSVKRLIVAGKPGSVVIQVPTQQWTDAVEDAVEEFGAPTVKVIARKEKPRKEDLGTAVSNALSEGRCVVGISHDVGLLPSPLVSAARHFVSIGAADVPVLLATMRRCLRGRVPVTLLSSPIEGLDFDDITAMLPMGSTIAEVLAGFRERSVPKNGAGIPLPDLTEAIEFGAARDWGLALARDIADYKAKKISWEDVDRGCLLHGPPGTGKTLLAQMIAQTCNVPIVIASMGDFFADTSGYLDSVLKAQREAFARARSKKPSILFLDEINALPDPTKLSPRGRDWWMPICMDFLQQLDSAISSREGVVVIGATNTPEDIYPAVLRPGRLERSIFVGPPTAAGLVRIMRHHLAGALPDADLTPLAEAGEIDEATGAQVMEWTRAARRAARRAGRPMVPHDLEMQIVPAETRNDAHLRIAAVHEAGHALAGVLLGRSLVRVTIARSNTEARGGYTRFEKLDTPVFNKEQLEHQVLISLAGGVAEELVLAQRSSGSGGAEDSDLAGATSLLASMRVSYGLADQLSWRARPDEVFALLGLDKVLREDVESDLLRLKSEARALLSKNLGALGRIIDGLISRRTLSGEQVETITRLTAAA